MTLRAAHAFVSLIVSALAAASTGCADTGRRVESFTIEETVSDLIVDLHSGDVTVQGSEERETHVTAAIRGQHCELSHGLAEGSLRLASRRTSDSVLRRRCDIDLVVSVPQNAALALETGAGDVQATGITGSVDANTGAGDIDVTEIGGSLYLESGAGDIDARSVNSATAFAHSGAGDVKASFSVPPDAVALETGAGDIVLHVPTESYDVTTSTGAGDVRIAGLVDDPASPRSLSLDSGAGDIEVSGS